MDEIQKRIEELEAEIRSLPAGYISRKTIAGKVRQYHQWSENGKKKSRYVDDASAEVLSAALDRRRALQQELRTQKALLPGRKPAAAPEEFSADVLLGSRLASFAASAASWKARNCLSDLCAYLSGPADGRVLILYGLRRTGKTTLMKQAIAQLPLSETAFLQIGPKNTLSEINRDLRKLASRGCRYVFLDEVTRMEDFIEGAALFSDVFASCGMKLVLSGTDSLGFLFSEDEQLYDRCRLLHTTFIPYAEFSRVLGICGIDEYICFGGTMSRSGIHYNELSTFASAESADAYVDSAIAGNIQHSLKCYQHGGHFRHLQELYDSGELTSAINRVVEDINHRFTLEVLTADFVSHDLGLSAGNLRRDRLSPTDLLDRVDREGVTERLREALEIRNRNEQTVALSEAHRLEIREYLLLLDLIEEIPAETLPAGPDRRETVLSQPGLRYAQAEALIRELMREKVLLELPAKERKHLTDRILSEIRGRMLEEIVLLETKKAHPEKQVFRLKFSVGEFDMVVADPEAVTCEIYEIKHSALSSPEQYRHLSDPEKCRAAAFRYGDILSKTVLYRGSPFTEGEIRYRNVEEYLLSLYPAEREEEALKVKERLTSPAGGIKMYCTIQKEHVK